jgi:hypothetical protein
MNTASTIIKSLILPLVVKFAKGDVNALPDNFWEKFAADFIRYEIDATTVFASLYQLELQNPEAVFEQLPQAYSSFINELAEEYVLGNQNEITTKLLENKNETFLKEVSFLKTMKSVITKAERNQLKKDLPLAYDRLVFELDEETLKQVAKKKSREDLRDKFKQWDEELFEEKIKHTVSSQSISGNKEIYDIDLSDIDSKNKLKKRSIKLEKKLKSTSFFYYLIIALVILVIAIIILIFFVGNDKRKIPEQNINSTELRFLNDSLRVKNYKGEFGHLSFTLIWNSIDDLDLIVTDPNDENIFFSENCKSTDNKFSLSGGQLDIDMNANEDLTNQPVENVFFKKKPPLGDYLVKIHAYNKREKQPVEFKLTLRKEGLVENEISGIISNQDEVIEIMKYEFKN